MQWSGTKFKFWPLQHLPNSCTIAARWIIHLIKCWRIAKRVLPIMASACEGFGNVAAHQLQKPPPSPSSLTIALTRSCTARSCDHPANAWYFKKWILTQLKPTIFFPLYVCLHPSHIRKRERERDWFYAAEISLAVRSFTWDAPVTDRFRRVVRCLFTHSNTTPLPTLLGSVLNLPLTLVDV